MLHAEPTLGSRGSTSMAAVAIAAAAVVGGVLLLGFLGGFLFFCCRKNRAQLVTQSGMQRRKLA